MVLQGESEYTKPTRELETTEIEAVSVESEFLEASPAELLLITSM